MLPNNQHTKYIINIAYKFLHDPANLIKLSDAFLKALAIEAIPVFLCAGLPESLEQMSRAFISYSARSFDSSLKMAASIGAAKYFTSPTAIKNANEFIKIATEHNTSLAPDFYGDLGRMPYYLIGALNHLSYKPPIDSDYTYVMAVETSDSLLKSIASSNNASMVVDGIQSGNITAVLQGYSSGITLDNMLIESAKDGAISVLSYNGFYRTAKPYLDMALTGTLSKEGAADYLKTILGNKQVRFADEALTKITIAEVFYDLAIIFLTGASIMAINNSNKFIAELGKDIAYQDYPIFDEQFNNVLLGQNNETTCLD